MKKLIILALTLTLLTSTASADLLTSLNRAGVMSEHGKVTLSYLTDLEKTLKSGEYTASDVALYVLYYKINVYESLALMYEFDYDSMKDVGGSFDFMVQTVDEMYKSYQETGDSADVEAIIRIIGAYVGGHQ